MIITENRGDSKPWWIDKEVHCVKCGSVGVLEEQDDVTICRDHVSKKMSAHITCPVCDGGHMLVHQI